MKEELHHRQFIAKWEKSELKGGLNLVIQEKDFWLFPDFESLASDESSLSPFRLRIGFDSTWERNSFISYPKRQQIRLAMEQTGQSVRDFLVATFSIPVPFETDHNEQDLVNAVADVISQQDRNLAELLDTPTGRSQE